MVRLSHIDSLQNSACKTKAGEFCKSPFPYEGKTFTQCTSYKSDKAWCPTQVRVEIQKYASYSLYSCTVQGLLYQANGEIVEPGVLLVSRKMCVWSCYILYIYPGCLCGDAIDLVCGMDGIDYPNPCEAECKGTLIECKGRCPCAPSERLHIFCL